jgi:phosphohistidine phosphatase
MNVQFDVILSSPLKRALQTASFVGTEMGYDARINTTSALAPAATVADFQKLVADCAKYENVLMVGHNPNITLFLASLIYPKGSRPAASLRMRKATIARINTDRQPNTLQWLLDMRLVRALYATSTISSRRKTSRK